MVTSDCSANTVYLVHPGVNKFDYKVEELLPIYEKIIASLIGYARVKVVSNEPVAISGADNSLADGVNDIWVRDFGVIQSGGLYYAPAYHPVYFCKPEHQPFLDTAPAFRNVLFPLAETLPIVLDLGNFVTNGRLAIVTDMVLKQNPGMTIDDVKHALAPLSLDQIFVAPKEPYDGTGHADGMFSFLDEQTLLLAEYENRSTSYKARLNRFLHNLDSRIDIVDVPCFPGKGSLSAKGCYVNLLSLPSVVLMPVFGHELDDKVYKVISAHTRKPVVTIEASALAEYGGVLHCITCTTKE